MIYPAFPQAGDTIGIFAPSAGVGHKLDSFDTSISTLKERGFIIRETDSVRMEGIRSNYADIRGKEFNSLASNWDVVALIAATGGEYNLEMLPYIDWKSFSRNPKWVAGASDPTNILYTITTACDVATIYGFNAGSFDWRPLHRFQTNALSMISGQIVRQDSFDKYDSVRDFGVEAPILDEDVHWDVFVPEKAGSAGGFNVLESLDDEERYIGKIRSDSPDLIWRTNCKAVGEWLEMPHGGIPMGSLGLVYDPYVSVDVRGRLIGGCIDCISKLIGTQFDQTSRFVDKYGGDGIIWYFDVFAMSAEELYLTLIQMKYCGYFRGTKAVIFGRVMFPGDSTDQWYIDHIRRCFDVPVIWNADIGHVKPCMTLINGSLAQVTSSGGKGSISMQLVR